MDANQGGGDTVTDLLTCAGFVLGSTSAREVVDEHHPRSACEERGDVEAPLARRHGRKPVEQRRGAASSVGVDDSDDDIGTSICPAPPFGQHGERGAHTRRGPQIDADRSSGHDTWSLPADRAAAAQGSGRS